MSIRHRQLTIGQPRLNPPKEPQEQPKAERAEGGDEGVEGVGVEGWRGIVYIFSGDTTLNFTDLSYKLSIQSKKKTIDRLTKGQVPLIHIFKISFQSICHTFF